MNNPNLLFVFSDQHRWCDLGCNGNSQVISPRFDQFAARAANITGCISNTPVCVPARGTLFTGLYPVKHRAVSNDMSVDSGLESIARLMNRNDYHTGYIGKWHLGGIPRYKPIKEEDRLGFTEWKVANCTHDYMNSYYYDENNDWHEIVGYEPITQTDMALDFIKRNGEKENPWGLVLSWGPPHAPLDQVPPEYLKKYEDTDIQLRPNVEEKILVRTGQYSSDDEMKESLKGYYAHITALDEQFGRLLDTLEETGQLDNTLVVYTSDHGDMLGSQGKTKKQWWYEEAVRVPLMVYWKGHTAALQSDEMIGLVDLPVSLMSLMGIPCDFPVDGEDQSRLFTGKDARGRDACYLMDLIACHQAYIRGSKEWRGIRTRKYTYVISAAGEDMVLFDNEKDPFQMTNLINNHAMAGVREELRKKLMEFVSEHDALLPLDDFVKKFDLKEEWNRSQRHFGYPPVD